MTDGRVGDGVRRWLLVLALLTTVVAGCGDDAASDDVPTPTDSVTDDEGGEDAAGDGGTALAGTMTGYLTGLEADGITFDEIEVLSGDEARAARESDGEPAVEEGVDVPYLRNVAEEAYEIPVAADVRVQVFDCSADCRLVDWDYDDLVAGAPLPYGTANSPFTVVVENGEVVEISEIYLP